MRVVVDTPVARERVERMGESYGGRGEGASVLAALRIVGTRQDQTSFDPGRVLGATLEATDRAAESPARIEGASPIETAWSPRPIAAAEGTGFTAFLDGIQQSRVLAHLDGVVPVVHATVAAAVRERRGRVMHTWGPGARIVRAILVPAALVDPSVVAALEAEGFTVVDTAPDPANVGHPLQLLAAARLRVQQSREAVEAELAAAWCAAGAGALYVDGGIGGLPEAARQANVVGVVKSHRTLYGDARIAQTVAALRPTERSGAFVVSTRRRTTVASWYLRLRDGAGDPLGGVVRVEAAESLFTPERADEVSAWILREREPVALPDSRWRVMAYGISDCEEFLRAVTA